MIIKRLLLGCVGSLALLSLTNGIALADDYDDIGPRDSYSQPEPMPVGGSAEDWKDWGERELQRQSYEDTVNTGVNDSDDKAVDIGPVANDEVSWCNIDPHDPVFCPTAN